MTKAEMGVRIEELEAEVEALKAGARVETHVHYHYPQSAPLPPQQPDWQWWPQTPYYVGTGSTTGGIPTTWATRNEVS